MSKRTAGYTESFAAKLFTSFAAVAMVCSMIFFVVDFLQENRNTMQNVENKGRLLSSMLAYYTGNALVAGNADMIKAAVGGVAISRDVLAVRIYDMHDRLLHEYRREGFAGYEFTGGSGSGDVAVPTGRNGRVAAVEDPGTMLFSMPVRAGEGPPQGAQLSSNGAASSSKPIMIGYVQVLMDRKYHERKVRKILITDMAISSVFLLAGGGLIYWHIGRATRPLTKLMKAVRSFGEGKQTEKVPVESMDEIGKLTDAFNSMTESLMHKEAERQKVENQFRHAQKMEAIGTMAGGMAHDFKNILTAIMGFANIVKIELEKDDPAREYVEHILTTSGRAATLVQSLLAFSRQQIMDPMPADVSDIVREIEKILQRLIREDIDFRIRLSDQPLVVMADSGQIGQALMNICANARDAMPDGGRLAITTSSVRLDESFFSKFGTPRPGQYAVITVADTGVGMDEEVAKKVFDPFFTTKEFGRGTGLGLSIVYGIVKQHEGYIEVESEPGRGSVFSMYIPLVHHAAADVQKKSGAVIHKGTETILVAEDDDEVRLFLKDILKIFGYKVIEACDGEEAVRAYQDNPAVELLLLDVVMPRKNGKEAYDEIRRISPEVKALFLSGYSADVIGNKGMPEQGLNFIEKPVSPEKLLGKVRELLDSTPQ